MADDAALNESPVVDERLLLRRLIQRLAAWDWDPPNDRLFLCPRAARYFNVSKVRAAEGVPIVEATKAIHPEDALRVSAAISETSCRGGPYEATYRVHDVQGQLRRIHAFGSCVLSDQGVPLRFTGVLIDVTDEPFAAAVSPFDAACDHLLLARAAAMRSGDANLKAICENGLRHIAVTTVASERFATATLN